MEGIELSSVWSPCLLTTSDPEWTNTNTKTRAVWSGWERRAKWYVWWRQVAKFASCQEVGQLVAWEAKKSANFLLPRRQLRLNILINSKLFMSGQWGGSMVFLWTVKVEMFVICCAMLCTYKRWSNNSSLCVHMWTDVLGLCLHCQTHLPISFTQSEPQVSCCRITGICLFIRLTIILSILSLVCVCVNLCFWVHVSPQHILKTRHRITEKAVLMCNASSNDLEKGSRALLKKDSCPLKLNTKRMAEKCITSSTTTSTDLCCNLSPSFLSPCRKFQDFRAILLLEKQVCLVIKYHYLNWQKPIFIEFYRIIKPSLYTSSIID